MVGFRRVAFPRLTEQGFGKEDCLRPPPCALGIPEGRRDRMEGKIHIGSVIPGVKVGEGNEERRQTHMKSFKDGRTDMGLAGRRREGTEGFSKGGRQPTRPDTKKRSW